MVGYQVAALTLFPASATLRLSATRECWLLLFVPFSQVIYPRKVTIILFWLGCALLAEPVPLCGVQSGGSCFICCSSVPTSDSMQPVTLL